MTRIKKKNNDEKNRMSYATILLGTGRVKPCHISGNEKKKKKRKISHLLLSGNGFTSI